LKAHDGTVAISSNSALPRRQAILEGWLKGQDYEIDILRGHYIQFEFKDVRTEFRQLKIIFSGSHGCEFTKQRKLEWRIALDGTAGNVAEHRMFEFVNKLEKDDTFVLKEIDAPFHCRTLRLSALSDHIHIAKLELFGLISFTLARP
jgi:hypothetical protein